MSSTSVLQPAVRHVRVRRQYRPAELTKILGRQARPVRRGSAQRRALLEARWRETVGRITALSIAYHDAAQLVPGGLPGGRGALSRRARRIARQVAGQRQILAEIEAALERITAGRYGWCEQCGRLIATARLAVRPHVRYCAACDRNRLLAVLWARRGRRSAER